MSISQSSRQMTPWCGDPVPGMDKRLLSSVRAWCPNHKTVCSFSGILPSSPLEVRQVRIGKFGPVFRRPLQQCTVPVTPSSRRTLAQNKKHAKYIQDLSGSVTNKPFIGVEPIAIFPKVKIASQKACVGQKNCIRGLLPCGIIQQWTVRPVHCEASWINSIQSHDLCAK